MASKPNSALRHEREQRGWSQQNLAKHIGATVGSIGRWERGIGSPNPSFLRQLCECFGKDAHALGFSQERLFAQEKKQPQTRQKKARLAPYHSLLPSGQTPLLFDPAIPLPPANPLIGRDEQQATIRKRLLYGGNVALNGLPGVGKTAFLTTLAHDPELRIHFKDGILWAGLGPHPNMQSHLSRWGMLLGLSQAEMSTLQGSEAWAIALHRTIGSRKVLLIIDDIWTLEDALTLKVGGPNCVYLVSTRFPLIASQMAFEGAMAIKELNSDEGIQFLRILAPHVVKNEMEKARELVMAVGGLPLAINLIGNYLRIQSYSGPARRIAAALKKLSDASERLNISEPRGPVERHPSLTNETPVSLHTVIAVTDQQLPEQTRQALHALSVFPPKPNSFSEEAALAVAACSIETLDEINNTGLLEINSADRYSLHQTIADYARLQLSDDSARQRLIAYITAFAEAHQKDYESLEREGGNIIASLEAAAELAHNAELIRITIALAPFLIARGLYPTAETYLQRAYNTAIATEDHANLARILLYLGQMTWKRGDFEQAENYLQDGLEYAHEIKNNELICALLVQLGATSWRTGNYQQAEAYTQKGLVLARQLSDLVQAAKLLDTLGIIMMRQGNYVQSGEYLQEGLKFARQVGERELACDILTNLGVQAGEQGNYAQAEIYIQEALTLARQFKNNEMISLLLNNLGDAASEQENYVEAKAYFNEGLELARTIGMQELISVSLINLASVARKQKHYDIAERGFQESLSLTRQINIPLLTAHVLYEYGNLHLDLQEWEKAEKDFQEALIIVPEGSQDMFGLAYYGLARTLAGLGKSAEAIRLGNISIQTLEKIGHRGLNEIKTWLGHMGSR